MNELILYLVSTSITQTLSYFFAYSYSFVFIILLLGGVAYARTKNESVAISVSFIASLLIYALAPNVIPLSLVAILGSIQGIIFFITLYLKRHGRKPV